MHVRSHDAVKVKLDAAIREVSLGRRLNALTAILEDIAVASHDNDAAVADEVAQIPVTFVCVCLVLL